MAYNFIDYLLGREPSREDRRTGYFGDTVSKFGNDELAAARFLLENAGTVAADSLPEEMGVYRNVLSYPADLVNAAMLGAVGGGQKAVAGISELFADDAQDEKRLARDILGGAEVVGVGPQSRAVSLLTAPAKAAVAARAPYLLSDVKYATRSLAEGDLDGVREAFYEGGVPVGVGADAVDDRPIIVRDGSLLAEELAQTPSVQEYMTGEPYIPMSNTTNIKSQKPTALSSHTSVIRPTGEGVPPTVRDGIENLEGKTIMAIVGDNSGRHDILRINDVDFSDDPIRSYAGFEFIDIPNQAYAGDKGPTAAKLKEAERTKDPYFMTAMMGEKSGDFAMHSGETYGRLFARTHDNISPKDYDEIDKSIQNMSAQIGGKTVYPYKDFPSVRDPNAIRDYIEGLPAGGYRGEFLKGLDKAKYQKWGLPKVSDPRLAVADTKQLGMDWGTMGYRGFYPDLEKGIFEATPEMSTTYQAAYDKVGNADTYLAESRGIPANLLMRNLSEAQRQKTGGARGGLLMDSAVYKQLEMSPKIAKQPVEPIDVDTIGTFLEVERTQGRDVALAFTQKVLSEGKVTNALIKQAKKLSAPQWVIAAMMTQKALQEEE